MAATLSATLWAYACGDGATEPPTPPPDPPRPTTVAVTPATTQLTALGDTVQLSAEVRDQNGQVMAGAAVTWSSSAASIAAVSGSGLVTAAGNGTATITATAGSASGSATVSVAQRVSSVSVSPAADTLVEGDTLHLSAEAVDGNGHAVAGAEFEWESSDTLVARVDDLGLVTGVAAGEAEITATSSGVTGRAQVTVAAPVPTTVEVTPDSVVFTAIGQTEQLSAEVRDQIGRAMVGVAVSWSSSDKLVATVDGGGLVTAVGSGSAIVSAGAGEVSGSAVVTVTQSAGTVTVSPPADTIAPGDTLRLVARVFDENGHPVEGAAFAWSSSDASVASVDRTGLVRGVAQGMATITVAAGQARGTAKITVQNPDRAALVAFYEATDGPNWVNNEGWLTDAPLGEWYGVGTDGFGRVLTLNLGGQWDTERGEWIPHGLQGPIPAELGSLTNLRYLRLDNNALTGSIPTELGSLTALRYLRLNNNALTGSIPTELGNLSNLESLTLYGNALTGPIPTELGSLTALRYLSLGGNELTGSIPTELGNLSNLESLQLYGNKLTGPIPTELGSLSNLESLQLGSNALTGPIPTELGSLSNLESLQLGSNALTGPIPTELGSLTALRYLFLGGNQLTGPIPTELGSLSNLESLTLGNNALTGPIPRSLLQLVNLRWLYFRWNDGLCAPGTAEFAAWIEAIEQSEAPFCNEADREALELLFETAGGTGWTKSDGWRATPALEEWHGVTADALGRVSALDLSGNRLAGKVPNWSQAALAHLTELRIGGNADLAGRLPLSLADFALRVFHYAGTGLCVPADAAFARWLSAITSHQGTGDECAPLSDREILEAVYLATGGPDWTNSENWLTEAPLSAWHGVRVDDQERVVGLSLFANRLRGTIPAELGKLTELRSLVLARNYSGLTGPIPAELGNLPNLEELYLYSNALNGAIPAELGNLPTLVTLSLLSNDLEGVIPPEIGNLANLHGLFLHDNDLEGAIPTELGTLANLQNLFLAGNGLTGSIPSTLSNLASLRRLSLVRNSLTGPLPAELGGLGALEFLYVGHNDLTGPVPGELGALTRVRALAFSGNADMSGALPSSLTNLQSLETLETSGTQLCAPSDPGFLEWLDQLPSPRVALCGSELASAYLVQAVQSRAFPVPLIAGEEALVRVFITAAQTNEERLPSVRASFHLDGALVRVADIPGNPGPIPTDVDEGSLAESANIVIPGEVVRPGLEMVIEIDPDGTLDPGLGVAKRIPETGRMPVDVREMPVFDLTVIPFLWNTDPNSTILEQTAGMAGDPEGHELLELTRILLPVGDLDVKAHEPVLSSSNDAYAIFGETRAIRAMEGGSGYYMGMMSGPVTGAGGLGSLGGPVSFSVPGSGVIAHELGHNMSLSHAPCGGASGPDPAFPYMEGATGAWGYDFRGGGRLVGPEEKDLMGYCGPDGISDYHFTKALNFRLDDEGNVGAALVAEAATSLLLWGGIDSTGTPYLKPSFVVDAPPELPGSSGEHRITGRIASGGELFSLNFTMPEVADGDGSSSFAFVLPVQSGWRGNLGSITLSGPGGSVTLDADSNHPMTILRDPRTGQVRAILRDFPGPDGAQADAAGALGVGRGLETLFSRGIPDAAAWRR